MFSLTLSDILLQGNNDELRNQNPHYEYQPRFEPSENADDNPGTKKIRLAKWPIEHTAHKE